MLAEPTARVACWLIACGAIGRSIRRAEQND